VREREREREKSRAHEREERKEGRAMAEKEDVVVSYGGGRGGFAIDDHVEYFKTMLQELPSPYEAQDTNRLVLAYLAVSALDLLNALHQVVAKDIIDWVYGLQVLPLNGDGNSTFEDGNSELPRLQPSSAAVKYIPLYVGCLSVP
jgi:prenyltransferase beta subunit